jgi:cyclomaltodextrinase / maltogenic alpha-amylase / neopullulanase
MGQCAAGTPAIYTPPHTMKMNQPVFLDNIFGTIIDLDQRLARHEQQQHGVRHLNRVVPFDPAPDAPLTVLLTTGGTTPYATARCWWRAERPDQRPAEGTFDLTVTDVEWDAITWGYVTHWAGAFPPQPAGTMLRYTIAAQPAGSNAWVFADTQAAAAATATQFAVWVADDPAPQWAREAVVYHVFLDRFAPDPGKEWLTPASLSGFYGGTLRGLISQLDYIQDLGFSAIWISPVFASPTHHGYDASDLYTVEPRLGTNADLLELFAEAHQRGMRVILDFVANHWSVEHATFKDAQTNPDSPYRTWYTWEQWPDAYATYFGVRELPELNLADPRARAHMLEAATHWLKAGADGLRLDYAHGPSHDFWSDFRRACRTAKPDCWLFGEIIHHADALRSYSGRMDGVLDFLLARALRDTFTRGMMDLGELAAFLAGHERYFPSEFVRPSFLDNHDMNRFLFMSHGDSTTLKLGALLLFSLAGPPIVYYGTEVGVTQERPIHGENNFGIFEEARQPMKWGAAQDADLHAFFRRLVGLRRRLPALVHGAREVLYLDSAAGVYAQVRSGAQPVITALNLGTTPVRLTLPSVSMASAADYLFEHPVYVDGAILTIELPGRSGALIA